MTSDFSRISETEYDKYTGNYTFYDKNKNIIISTYDIIFSLDIAYNPIFNIAIFDPPAEQDIKIKNIINSLFFPEKLKKINPIIIFHSKIIFLVRQRLIFNFIIILKVLYYFIFSFKRREKY